MRRRLARHLSELVRLAWPVIVARAGVMVMALVDIVMVGHYATRELAYLGIGMAPFMPVFLTLLGLLLGTAVVTSAALGADRPHDCGAAWRRSIPYAVGLGMLGALATTFGEPLLLLAGQTPELAANGGRVMFWLGLGLPAYLLYITSALFLEGVKNPKPAMLMMLVANVVNVGLNWVLIYGHLGFPAMGAEGSAITSSFVRWLLMASLVAYIWTMPGHTTYGVRLAPQGGWKDWAAQRRVGYSAAVSIGVESLAFSFMGIFAGWLGTVALAAFSIAHNLLAMAFMVSLGFGAATGVRVAIASGRGDLDDRNLAGWTGFGANVATMTVIGLIYMWMSDVLAAGYSNDIAVITVAIPLIAYCALIVVTDGGQAVMVHTLRSSGGIWAPALIQSFCFLGLMVPLGWLLALHWGHGAPGLFQAMLIASASSLILLSLRFRWIADTPN